MDFNMLLIRLGIDNENFVNKIVEPIPFEGGFIYEIEQRKDIHKCPYCGSEDASIKDYRWITINASQSDLIKDIIKIRKVRFRCNNCKKTYTPKITGIQSYSKTTQQTKFMIIRDFNKMQTFAEIAERYGISKNRVIQLFDSTIKHIPRKPLPKVLCIDEIRFSSEYDQKYCCVLYDYNKGTIIDIIRNRQLAYLNEYFSSIPLKEREGTTIFISDMYDGYSTVCSHYFPKATHIVDKFHVIIQLSRALNSLRVKVMNLCTEKGSPKYNFMKSNWKCFLCKQERIPDKTYTYMKTGEIFHYDEILTSCLRLNLDLAEAYTIYQDLLHASPNSTHEECEMLIKFISNKLKDRKDEGLRKVGDTYYKWRYEISNAYYRESKKELYTNAIAESLNNQLKTIIKISYGYSNFDRFRKRALLIMNAKKTNRKRHIF